MDSKYPKLDEVVLGAFLHDIGKFAQRTGEKQYRSSYEELLCPYQSDRNYYSHRHVLYTDGFLSAHKEIFPLGLNSNFIVNTAAKHHKPDTSFEWMVAVADRLSSGTDRMARDAEEEGERYYKQPLKSIFSKVHIKDESNPRKQPETVYHELEKLSPETVFPKAKVEFGHGKYASLWLDFENALSNLKGRTYSVENFFTLLDNILLHYTWSIPSSTIDDPDISLYDHSVTTAALTAALYRYHEYNNTLTDLDSIKNNQLKKFLFVSGDLSGIQDYIFRSSDTKAKILRAKSFEIQAFSEAVSRHILQSLNLPPVCKIMDAGGRFLLLLPNTESTKESLEQLRSKVEEWSVQKYFGQLTLNLSQGIEASGLDLDQKKARFLFSSIAQDTARTKQTKLQNFLNGKNHLIEKEYTEIESNQDVCECCGKRKKETKRNMCTVCFSQTRFGERIPKNNYLAWIENQPEGALNLFGKTSMQSYADLRDIPEYTLPIAINQFDPRFGTLYTPYYLPLKENGSEVMDFTDIADKAEGKNYLAMLKADVDNLGYIFSSGIGERISLSRYASLSRMLNFYFSACINHSLKTKYRNLYMVFSGGDDLCLIGPWDQVLDYVADLQKEFTRFTGNNPSVTISYGISLAGAKMPIHNIAEEAEVAEREAKLKKPGKIHVFKTITDGTRYEELISAANQLSEFMQKEGNEKVTSGSVYRLLNYGRREKALKEGDISKENAMWRSHFFYDTARNIKKSMQDTFRQFVVKHIHDMNFIASYALYKNRKKEVS